MPALDLRDLARYPFLKEAQAYISAQTSSPEQFLASSAGRLAVKEAIDTLTSAIRFNPRQPGGDEGEIPSEASTVSIIIAAYPVSRMLVSCSGDRMLIDRLCRYQSWRVFRYLQDEEPGKKEIIASGLGIEADSEMMPVIRYIEIAARLTGEKWRLVNREVRAGQVRIHPDEMDEILRERLRVIMMQNLPLKVPAALCTTLQPALDRIQGVLQERMLEEFGTVEESAFPPCIQAIIGALISRSHLTHMGRFAVTAFLHNIGMENTRIVELYGHVPDFDVSKTMYQVDHISGRGGSGTEYTSPLCSTMRTHSLCVHPDVLCSRVTHPLTYYKQKKRMIGGGKRKGGSDEGSGGNIPDKVSAGADDPDKEKQRDEIRSSARDQGRDNKQGSNEEQQT